MRTTGASSWIRPEKRLAVYIRDNFQCAYCGADLGGVAPEEMGLDHLVCSVNGGSNHESNIVTACRTCNSSRGTRPWREYAPGGAQARIEKLVAKPLNVTLAKAILAESTAWADR